MTGNGFDFCLLNNWCTPLLETGAIGFFYVYPSYHDSSFKYVRRSKSSMLRRKGQISIRDVVSKDPDTGRAHGG